MKLRLLLLAAVAVISGLIVLPVRAQNVAALETGAREVVLIESANGRPCVAFSANQ